MNYKEKIESALSACMSGQVPIQTVSNINQDASKFDVTFTFKDGEEYCCTELGCHFNLLGTWNRKTKWEKFRNLLEKQGLKPKKPIKINNIDVIVEQGTRLDIFKGEPCEYQTYSYDPLMEQFENPKTLKCVHCNIRETVEDCMNDPFICHLCNAITTT